jgi:hypothetical protein
VIVAAPAEVSAACETGVAEPVISADKTFDPAAPKVGRLSMFAVKAVEAEIVAKTTFTAVIVCATCVP